MIKNNYEVIKNADNVRKALERNSNIAFSDGVFDEISGFLQL